MKRNHRWRSAPGEVGPLVSLRGDDLGLASSAARAGTVMKARKRGSPPGYGPARAGPADRVLARGSVGAAALRDQLTPDGPRPPGCGRGWRGGDVRICKATRLVWLERPLPPGPGRRGRMSAGERFRRAGHGPTAPFGLHCERRVTELPSYRATTAGMTTCPGEAAPARRCTRCALDSRAQHRGRCPCPGRVERADRQRPSAAAGRPRSACRVASMVRR